MTEARLTETGSGLAPVDDGWFVLNVRDAEWSTSASFGSGCSFESREAWFRQLGLNITALEPGQPGCMYHSENQQEAFLVLHGECRLLVDGVERLLGPWDFFNSPAGTEHVFVGAGNGPCVILMVGARTEDERFVYPVSELAAQYGASVREETSEPREAYAQSERSKPERPPYWDRLPWA